MIINYHQDSKIISKKMISSIEEALESAWSRESTDPKEADNWSENNKAYGQCAVTSVLINDLFGGRMIYDKANFHIWNELPDGTQHDFTRSQFTNEKVFSVYKYKNREDILYDESGRKTHIEDRYFKLKDDLPLKIIIFVTGNERKLGEARLGCQIFDVGVEWTKLDISEIQSQIPNEISGKKAEAAFEQIDKPLVVTDTYWNIASLKGFPGGYMKDVSAWFTSEDFLNLMKGKKDRRVSFTESITYKDKKQLKVFSKEYQGLITESPRGTGNSIENVAEFEGVTLGERRQQGGYSHEPEEYIWYNFANWFGQNRN
ncbi:MAG: dITP/XTP pyrophosphatase [Microgenomates group bacterium Gr01-1014_16]|nr:MAG: dITP/XTP pyrophosphatase [Microgenomates group bacterium Gr01-1014_16]